MVMPANPTRSNSRPVASSSWWRRSAARRYARLVRAGGAGGCNMDIVYICTVDVINEVVPNPSSAAAFFAGPEEGPFVMVNLLRFKDRAEYPDGVDADLSG